MYERGDYKMWWKDNLNYLLLSLLLGDVDDDTMNILTTSIK